MLKRFVWKTKVCHPSVESQSPARDRPAAGTEAPSRPKPAACRSPDTTSGPGRAEDLTGLEHPCRLARGAVARTSWRSLRLTWPQRAVVVGHRVVSQLGRGGGAMQVNRACPAFDMRTRQGRLLPCNARTLVPMPRRPRPERRNRPVTVAPPVDPKRAPLRPKSSSPVRSRWTPTSVTKGGVDSTTPWRRNDASSPAKGLPSALGKDAQIGFVRSVALHCGNHHGADERT